MQWKDYLQFNELGQGDAYAWAYDEAVCAISGNQRTPDGYPWCTTHDSSQSAVNPYGIVTDYSCPCTVENPIAPLGAVGFSKTGWGTNMFLYVYDVMWPGYRPPTSRNNFQPNLVYEDPAEADNFYLKIVNQYDTGILVYLERPPAWKNEYVTNPIWNGWQGPTSTLRGQTGYQYAQTTPDAWASRITLADNISGQVSTPVMRVTGENAKPLGAFYVPVGQNLRIQIAEQGKGGGWFGPAGNAATIDSGCSLWVTRDDAYNYPNRDPLLLLEVNVNTARDPQNSFDDATIWYDVSAVDGISANVQLLYSDINRMISVPLYQQN